MALHVRALSGRAVPHSTGSLQACSGVCPLVSVAVPVRGSIWGSGLALVWEAEAVAVQAAGFPWRFCLVCV